MLDSRPLEEPWEIRRSQSRVRNRSLQAVLLYTALQRTSVSSAVVITSLQPLMLMPMTARPMISLSTQPLR